MAKGNMLLGYARGSVGDVTFYRDGGLQRARARNRKPANPRTRTQQTQRAIFSNAVKFYKDATAHFFKFAFENKAVNESDYNAFMRENIRRGVMMSRTAFYDGGYPALGNWLVSRGSLNTVDNVPESDGVPRFNFGVVTDAEVSATMTIGALSNILLQDARYQVGDIITIIQTGSTSLQGTIPNATPSQNDYTTKWQYVQFLIDPNSTATFASIFDSGVYWMYPTKSSSNTLYIAYGAGSTGAQELWEEAYQGVAIIHSRNTANGLRVSTQELQVNPNYQTAIDTAISDNAYKSAVLADWSAEPNAILQGEGLELTDPF